MTDLWISLALGVVMLGLIVVLIWRERGLRKQLDEYRELLTRAAERQNIHQDGDAERFKRSQYFARIGTWDWEVDTDRLYWSDAIYGMFGFKIGEITPSYALFCACVHPDDRVRVREGELRCLETGENHDEEYRVVWPDGTIRWLRETGNVVRNDHDAVIKMMGVVRDITEEKASASYLQHLAHFDPLTGLPNRLVLEERLSEALEQARRSLTRVALVFIDLNGFKAINDHYGHAAGDRVLITTATRLKRILRATDTVARIGGDEFVVILQGLARASTCRRKPAASVRRFSSNCRRRSASAMTNATSAPALASRYFPTMRRPWTDCCTLPTWRCMRPSAVGTISIDWGARALRGCTPRAFESGSLTLDRLHLDNGAVGDHDHHVLVVDLHPLRLVDRCFQAFLFPVFQCLVAALINVWSAVVDLQFTVAGRRLDGGFA